MRRARWLTRLLDAYQIWDAQTGGWLTKGISIAMAALAGLWTYLEESWLPLTAICAIGAYLFSQRLLPQLSTHADSSEAIYAYEDGIDDATHDLNMFAIDYVAPLVYAHILLQENLVCYMIQAEFPASLATAGLMSNYETREFNEHYTALINRFGISPQELVPLGELKIHILYFDKNFDVLTKQTCRLITEAGSECMQNEKRYQLRHEIRTRHNALVIEYKKIKRDRRFAPELYRAGIDGPWTKEIE